jgi:hypothetical protein
MTEVIEAPPGFLVGKDAMRDFVLSSNGSKNAHWTAGLFTIANQRAGTHKTYIVRKKDKETPMWFVRYLGGDDNADPDNYFYLGLIKGFDGPPVFNRSKASPGKDAPVLVAFNWFFNDVLMGPRGLPPSLTMNHLGFCGACGKLLSVDTSVRRGYGPKCFGGMR